MSESRNALATVWGWIKNNEPTNPNPYMRFEFTAQQVSQQLGKQGIDPHVLDALWQLVSSGILMPTTSTPQFRLSGWGERAIQQDTSPHEKHEFLEETQLVAPHIEPDSVAYLSLGLDCMYGTPAATIALTRVALEIEIDSVIDRLVESQNPGNTARRVLSNRNIATRVEELFKQIRSRDLMPQEDLKLFESHTNVIRISGNRILHPKSGMPLVDPLMVQSVLYAFRSFAHIASSLKEQLK